ncbi:MAG: ATP-binding cassette domain-containing protein [Acidobacteriota bacterium]
MIRFEQVRKVFPGVDDRPATVAVDSVDLRVAQGETLALIGTSGSGKTTLLRMVNRLIDPSAGRIVVDDSDVAAQDVIALRRRIGYVIQRGGLFPHLDVAQNIGLLCTLEGWPRRRIAERVEMLLKAVQLDPSAVAGRRPQTLSGGQQQRVAVARALALDPPVLLMDEPFGALDPITRAKLHDLMRDLRHASAKTTLLVTHDLAEAFALGDRVALIDRGRIVQLGTEDDLRRRPVNDFVAAFVARHAGAANQGNHRG